ncbi:hypothetical protein EGT07_18185 [Herbaspirillum sp. HC18]|nr:hypothetical protein EGT07_18185 [Herbaspirillum sp. HC18]
MKTPIETIIETVEWTPVEHSLPQGVESDLPYATHAGTFCIGGLSLRCYRLNDGRAIIDAEDMNGFFGLIDADPVEGME